MKRLGRGSLFGLCGWLCLCGVPLEVRAERILPVSANGPAMPVPPSDVPAFAVEEANTPAVRPQVVKLVQAPGTPSPATPAPATPAPATPRVPTLPDVDITAQPPAPGNYANADRMNIPSILQGTVFASPPVRGYNAQSSTVGTFMDVPQMTFPGSINTITGDVIRDQNVLYMDDVIRNIPSAVKSFGGDGVIRSDQFFVRGFEVTSQNWRKDGYLDPTYMPRDPANIERIDVLKGPSSTLYGSAQPTGTFNVVTKKAQVDPFARAGFMTGSYGLQRYTFDVNNGLRRDGSLLFRINGAYQNGNSNVATVFNERTFIAPTVTWLISDDTSLTWSGEYQKDRFRMYQGVPAINGDPFAISRNTFTGDPNGDVADYTSYRTTLTLEHQINDNWTARVGEMSLWYNTPSVTTVPDNGTLNGAGLISSPIMGRDQTVANPFNEQNHDILETLAGDVEGPVFRHRAVFGSEQDWFITNHDTFTSTSGTFGAGSSFGAANFASGSSFPLGPAAPFSGSNVFDNPAFRQNRYGVFFQDIIDLTPRLHLLVGGRFDYLQQTYSRSNTFNINGVGPVFATGDIYTQNAFYNYAPRVGMTYDLVPDETSLYWTYARSFTPSVGVANLSSTVLLPQYGDIWEGGVKQRLTDNLMMTTSGYYMRQQNVNVESVIGATPVLSQAGLETSQGVETNLTGQFTRRLSTISNFGYNDSLLFGVAQAATGSSTPIDQTRVRGVPHWTGSVWARYNLLQNQYRTVGLAVGTIYVGQRVGDYASPLILPSYNTWQSGVYYNQGRWSGGLVWDNIFNVNYAVSSINQYQVIQGMPSNVRISLGATF
ncbi:MAG: TonB-dependent receptor [Planctomycetes bacterium]|nr:TonB-dependent receptor [Planctomycetota bacterium]